VLPDFRCWRHLSDIGNHLLGQPCRMGIVDQFQPIDEQPLLLAQRHGGAPPLPAILAAADIKRGSEDSDRYTTAHLLSICLISYPNAYHHVTACNNQFSWHSPRQKFVLFIFN
jgi:hypothetical protein